MMLLFENGDNGARLWTISSVIHIVAIGCTHKNAPALSGGLRIERNNCVAMKKKRA